MSPKNATTKRTPAYMKRGSWVVPQRPSVSRMSMASRRSLLKTQALSDKALFDSSLGCPLSSYDHASLALVGGKALQCWRLMKHGLNVPASFIIPTYVYSLHIDQAGVNDLVKEVFSLGNEDLRDDEIRDDALKKLDTIRTKIMETPLNDEVKGNLKVFLKSLGPLGEVEVAVRSSGSAEDLASQSFAGQYDTYLYKKDPDDIFESIKSCWASMFKSHILDYALRPSFLQKNVGESIEPNVYELSTMKAPKMGVLVMKMIDPAVSGVCFTKNLWGSADEVMVEAVLGQGEGLVGGEVTPDRYVVNKHTSKLCYQEVHKPTQKFARAPNGGVEKVSIDPSTLTKPCILDASDLKAIVSMARAVEDYYSTPQDIEWCIDARGTLHLLQSRPITTLEGDKTASLSFLPPGEGYWSFDPTHNPRPLTPWFQQKYSFDNASYHGRRMGSLFQSLKFRFVHGFAFSQPVFTAPSPELERAADAYWSKKLYEDDYREFCDFFRPHCESLQGELREVNPSSLSHYQLIEHVIKCYDFAAEFWSLHHTYTMPAIIVVGDFMNRMAELTGKTANETLVLLEGASPESRGLLNREDPLLSEMYDLLDESEQAAKLLEVEEDQAAWALDCLLHMPGELGDVMRKVVTIYGWRLTGNYDLVTPALIESPYFFLKTIASGLKEGPDEVRRMEERLRTRVDEWKSNISEDKHDEFDEILDVGRRFFRMRDERGLCTDLSGIGLCRRGLLEAGARLEAQGVLKDAGHLCVATKQEAVALLNGDLSILSKISVMEAAGGASSVGGAAYLSGPSGGSAGTTSKSESSATGALSIPTPREMERRYNYIMEANPALIPKGLGTPPPPPPADMTLPNGIARTMGAFESALVKAVLQQWKEDDDDDDEEEEEGETNEEDEFERKDAEDDDDFNDIEPDVSKPRVVRGVAASVGMVEGPCRLVLKDGDLQTVQKGDIVVTYSCSASFNVILALCAGICTDYGGMLSHAAIVAREYGIPAIVGTQDGTSKFRNGDWLRVDCSTGKVKVIKKKKKSTDGNSL